MPLNPDGVRLLAEWEPQSAILITWPDSKTDWADDLEDIETFYLELCRHITHYQKLLIICRDTVNKVDVTNKLNDRGIIEADYSIYCCEYNDTWCRDYGPLFTTQNNLYYLNDLVFDGWGGKYLAEQDNAITQRLYKHGAFQKFELKSYDFVLEGGSIDTDGQGTIMTTNCLLKRHPDKSVADIEAVLKNIFGANRILWLETDGVVGDDTEGHIDMLARFINPDTIVYSNCDDEDNPNYASMQKLRLALSELRQTDGQPYNLIPLDLPDPKIYNDEMLPVSYVNFLIINNAVLIPTYDDPGDKNALQILNSCFPDRDIIGINSTILTKQYGSLHCATMQIPAGVTQP